MPKLEKEVKMGSQKKSQCRFGGSRSGHKYKHKQRHVADMHALFLSILWLLSLVLKRSLFNGFYLNKYQRVKVGSYKHKHKQRHVADTHALFLSILWLLSLVLKRSLFNGFYFNKYQTYRAWNWQAVLYKV